MDEMAAIASLVAPVELAPVAPAAAVLVMLFSLHGRVVSEVV